MELGTELEPQEQLGTELGKGLSLEERRLRRDLLALHNSLTGAHSRRGRALLPGNWDRRRGFGPGEAQVGHQLEFPHGKGGQALSGAALGGLESPSLEVSKESLDKALSALAGDEEGIGRKLVLEVFFQTQ
ncbi:hypothetical protein DUI87_22194 [Hirundo rustica rustica]|uniref:Uncharacterized protein n=1 Tax=Hirundo rustica rustica TaxID=333673 RepID=A0A3M0JKM0_HIRRU|nr:hypothetical protein DUI87_22194 [Hirundo rustica rustica]